jgi:hypothetical protein
MANRSLGVLTVDLLARTGMFETGMTAAERTTDKAVKKIKGSLGSLKGSLTGVAAGFLAGFGIVETVSKIVSATAEAEEAYTQLQTRIQATGGVAGVTARELRALAQELSSVTTFGTSAVVSMQSLLLTFTNIRGETVESATRSILDLSAALGQDLASSAQLVGKALNDPAKGLKSLTSIGITFTGQQKKLIESLQETGQEAKAQAIILQEIQKRFGGSAVSSANTLGGSIKRLEGAFGDLFETRDGAQELTKSIQNLTKTLQDPATVAAAQALTGLLLRGFGTLIDVIEKVISVAGWFWENRGKMSIVPEIEYVGREFGIFGSDIDRLRDDIEFLEEQLNTIPIVLSPIWSPHFKKNFGIRLKKDLEQELQQLNLELNFKLRERDGSQGPTRRLGPAAFRALPGDAEAVEQIEKMRDGLIQQIATFDEGAAAVMRYRIATGDLAETFKKARKDGEPLRLQLVALADIAEKQSLTKKIEDETKSLRDQAAVLGMSAGETMRYRVTVGDLAETLERMGESGARAAAALIAQAKATELAKSKLAVREMTRDLRDQAATLGMNAEQTMRYRITVGDLAEMFRHMGDAGRYAAAVLIAEAKKAEEAINEFHLKQMTKDLRDQIATFGQGAAQVMRYRLVAGDLKDTYDNTTEAGKAFADEVVNLTLQMQVLEEATKGADDAISEMSESLNESLDKFLTDFEKKYLETRDVLLDFMQGLASGTENIIADALENGFKDGASGILKSFGQLMQRLIAEAVAADLAKRIFGSVAGGTGTGWLGQLAGLFGFGGPKASGGPVMAGVPYLVGERGPEVMVPTRSGTIVPNGKIGGQTNYITLTVQTPTGRVPMETQQQIGNRLARALGEARRRNG